MRAGKRYGRLNVEKIAFIAASAWLLVMALDYVRAPEVPSWGPAKTDVVGAPTPAFDLDHIPEPPLEPSEGSDPFRGDGPTPPPPPRWQSPGMIKWTGFCR